MCESLLFESRLSHLAPALDDIGGCTGSRCNTDQLRTNLCAGLDEVVRNLVARKTACTDANDNVIVTYDW